MTETRIPLWRVVVQLHYRRIIPPFVFIAVSDFVVSDLIFVGEGGHGMHP